jgi:MFS transporter, SHS family, sialic acid transporter
MGGAWSLGVALVMEVWAGRSRALLAGLMGAAANAGYTIVALLSLGLGSLRVLLSDTGFSPLWVAWRLLILCGIVTELLTFLIRQFVPESRIWEQEKSPGTTSAWATQDLFGVLFGVAAGWGIASQPEALARGKSLSM